MRLRKTRALRDPGFVEIAAWEQWFRTAHAQRLLHEFPDTHLLAEERARTDAQIDAMVAKMRADYLTWSKRDV